MVQTRTPDAGAPAASTTKVVWLLPLLSVLWLLVEVWAARGQIRNSGGGTVALATAANALPGVVQAAIVAGAGAALATGVLHVGTPIRWLARVAAGAVAGGVAAILVDAAYPHLPSVRSIEVTLVLAGMIGAALTGIPRIAYGISAGIAAMLAALVMTTLLNSNVILSHMLTWFGAGSTASSVIDASKLVQYVDYTVIGIIAGVTAYRYLRRRAATWFPLYLIGGALAGILSLIGFGLTEIGGARLMDAANSLSDADRILNQLEASESVPNAMIVLFVGAFVALFAYGRTLKPAGAAPTSTGAKPTSVKPASTNPTSVKPTSARPAGAKPARTTERAGAPKPTSVKSASASSTSVKPAGSKSTSA